MKEEPKWHIALPEASTVLLNLLSFFTVGPQFGFPDFYLFGAFRLIYFSSSLLPVRYSEDQGAWTPLLVFYTVLVSSWGLAVESKVILVGFLGLPRVRGFCGKAQIKYSGTGCTVGGRANVIYINSHRHSTRILA